MLVQPSVFKRVKARTKIEKQELKINSLNPDEDDGPSIVGEDNDAETTETYQKDVEEGLREWITASVCRCDVADRYFGNPESMRGTFKACPVLCH